MKLLDRLSSFVWMFAVCIVGSAQAPSTATCGPLNGAPELVVQTGHSVAVHAARFSPLVSWKAVGFPDRDGNGEILVTGSNDGTVRVWDTLALREVRTLPLAIGSSIGAIALSPDGTKVAAAGERIVKIWDVATGQEILTLRDGPTYGRSIAFSQDGTRLAAGDERTARVWELAPPQNFIDIRHPAQKLAFGPNDILVVAGHDPIPEGKSIDLSVPYRVAAWDVRARSLVGSFSGQGYYVHSIAIGADGSISVWGGGSCVKGELCNSIIRRTTSGAKIEDLRGPPWYPTGGNFCPDTHFLAAGSNDGRVMLWDVEAQKVRYEGKASGQFVEEVSCSHDGARLVSGESRGRVAIWEHDRDVPAHVFEGFANSIDNFVADPPSRHLLFLGRGTSFQTGYTETLLRWDVTSLKTPLYLAGASSPVSISGDGRWLAVGKDKRTIILYRDEKPSIDTAIPSQGTAVAFSNAGDRYAASTETGITVWNTNPWRQEGHVESWTKLRTETVAFSNDGAILASAGGEGSVSLWEVPSMHFRCRLGWVVGPEHTTWTVAFSPKERILASAGNDRVIQLWDIDSCNRIGTLSGHGSSVHAISFSSDGALLASAGWDGTVRLWDVETKQPKGIFVGHGWLVSSVRFIASNNILVSGGWDGTARFWDVRSGRQIGTLVTFRDGRNWLMATPQGYFDSTSTAADNVYWRIGNTNELVPLSRYYTDFFRPGLLTELLQGERPVPEIDIAASLGIPGLRTMLSSEPRQARLERRNDQMLICLSIPPGVVLPTAVNASDRPFMDPKHGLKVVPSDADCKYQLELSDLAPAQLATVQDFADHPPEKYSTPWDGKESSVARSRLHVLTIGVDAYSQGSGFDPLPFPVASANRLSEFFRAQVGNGTPYQDIKVWNPLLDSAATTEAIQSALSEIAADTRSDDVVLIYLAGHGQVDFGDEMFYFASANSSSARLSSTGVSTAMLADALREMNARRVILLVDACQAGGTIEALQRVAETRAAIEKLRETSAVGYQAEGIGIYVVAATLPLSYALGTSESAFVSALIEALTPQQKTVRIREAVRIVQNRLPSISEQKFNLTFRQTPLVASVGLDFPITRPRK
jgi:WD40 repeat protein